MPRYAEVWPGTPVGSELSITFTPMSDKPPLGLRPRWLVLSDRADEIKAAIQRYETLDLLCPDDWLIELRDIERQQAILDPPTPTAEPTPEPTPAAPEFRVGQVWRTRKGRICKVTKICNNFDTPIETDLYRFHLHKPNGGSCLASDDQDHEDDLVELISDNQPQSELVVATPTPAAPEPEPEQEPQPELQPEIPEPLRTGAASFYVLVVSDDNPRFSGGEPIVWEHPIRETTLQAALQRRDSIGYRYGTTYIAECRIIPELTREVPADDA